MLTRASRAASLPTSSATKGKAKDKAKDKAKNKTRDKAKDGLLVCRESGAWCLGLRVWARQQPCRRHSGPPERQPHARFLGVCGDMPRGRLRPAGPCREAVARASLNSCIESRPKSSNSAEVFNVLHHLLASDADFGFCL